MEKKDIVSSIDDCTLEVLRDLAIKAAADVVSPQTTILMKEYTLIPNRLVEALTVALNNIHLKHKKNAEISKLAIEKTEQIKIPQYVIIALRQYHSWGVDLYSFKEVEIACTEHNDRDVLTFIVQYRDNYSLIISNII